MKGLVHLWNTWGIQILVLASFTLQLFLLSFGGIRRRSSSAVLRVSLWLAYLLADSTAIYALGRLSIVSRSGENQLVSFWAPFLLLHLGGPDNITAYALEDNSLWLRHLQTLVVQVLGAAYVVYKYIPGNGILLLLATISMFVSGLVKYGERIWALKWGSMSSIRDRFNKWDHSVDLVQFVMEGRSEDEILLEAHRRFGVCMGVFLDVTLGTGNIVFPAGRISVGREIYKLVEMELSLMYDILYTKAAVVHTWYGICTHLTSLLGSATALPLFLLSIRGRGDGHPYSRADVIISYVLLVGALVLEAMSVCRAVFSSWTCSFVHIKAQRASGESRTLAWLKWLLHVWAWLRRPFQPASGRLWRGSVGQFNLFHLCTRDTAEPWSRLAAKMGLEDWWNKLHFKGTFSGTESLSTEDLKELVLQALPLSDIDATHTNLSSRGRMTLENAGAYMGFAQWSVNIDFDQSILIWHVATDVFIRESNTDHESNDFRMLVDATRVLSNYMMFLLVAKPEMLPGHVRHNLYLDMCTNLEYYWTRIRDHNQVMGSHRSWNLWHILKELFHHDGPNCSRMRERDALAAMLSVTYENEVESIERGLTENPRFRPFIESGHTCAVLLAKELLEFDEMLDALRMIFGVWVEMMLYAADHCSRDSHARQLSNGGELITIVWLLVYHRMYIERYNAYIELVPSTDV